MRGARSLFGRSVTAIVLLGAALASCSLRSDDKPRAIPSVPKALSQASPTSSPGTAVNPAAEMYSLYLVRTQGSTETLRSVKVPIVPPANVNDLPRVIIERLVNNPPVSDNSDLKSDIPPGMTVRKVEIDPVNTDVLNVDLHGLGDVQGANQRLAVAQIVFTATAIEKLGIVGVRFSLDGTPTPVLLDADRSSNPGDVITRDDFPRVRPGASAASSTTTEPLPEDAPPSGVPDGSTEEEPVK